MNAIEDMFEQENSPANYTTSYVAIKVKFLAQERKIYGYLLLIFAPSGDYRTNTFLSLTTYSTGYNTLGVNSSFKDFYDVISDKTSTQTSFQSTNFKIKSAIENNFTITEITPQKSIKIRDILDIEYDLKAMLRKLIGDKKVTVFTFLEYIHPDDYNDFFAGNTTEKTPESTQNLSLENEIDIAAEVNIPRGIQTSPINLILAPVDGKPIFDLRMGDQLFVSIPSEKTADSAEAPPTQKESTKDAPPTQKESTKENPAQKSDVRLARVTGNFYFEGTCYIGIEVDINYYAIAAEEANIRVKTARSSPSAKLDLAGKNKPKRSPRTLVLIYLVAILILSTTLFLSFIWLL